MGGDGYVEPAERNTEDGDVSRSALRVAPLRLVCTRWPADHRRLRPLRLLRRPAERTSWPARHVLQVSTFSLAQQVRNSTRA